MHSHSSIYCRTNQSKKIGVVAADIDRLFELFSGALISSSVCYLSGDLTTKSFQAFTLLYIFCVGSYRGLYIVNWIYRYFTEPNYWQVSTL